MTIKDKVNEVLDFKEDFVDKLNELFGVYGCFVFDHPYWVIAVSLLCSIIPVFGFLPSIARWVDGADNLYALPVSEARNAGVVRDTIFAEYLGRANFMIITSNPPGHNVLNWEILEYAKQVDEIVKGKRVDEHSGLLVSLPPTPTFYPEFYSQHNESAIPDKERLVYEDICAPDPVTGCRIQSVFEAGLEDTKLLLADDSAVELYMLDGLVFNGQRKGYAPSFLFGEMEYETCVRSLPLSMLSQLWDSTRYNDTGDGMATAEMECITSAKALNFVYETHDKPEYQARLLAWETHFYDVLNNNQYYGPLRVAGNAFRSRDDELSKATAESSDVIFVLYTFILLIVYTTLVNFNLDLYRNKAMASLAGSVACLLGLYAGLGIPSLFGCAFVPTSLIAPFLVMGVGADDIFVLIGSYALAYGEDSARQRCAVVLRGSGVSVVMTTVTNVIAFAIGIQSPYLSVRNFCIFTLFGLLFSLIYELTLFFAVICLDARREENQKAFYKLSYESDETRKKTPFDIRTAVSTYQVVHVIVQGIVGGMSELSRVPVTSKEDLCHLNKFQLWVFRFKEAGRAWHRPEQDGITPATSTTQDVPDDADSEFSVSVDIKPVEAMHEEEEDEAFEDIHLIEQLQTLMKPKVPINRFQLNPKLSHAAYRDEPKGNVGRNWRRNMVFYYCRCLINPVVKLIIIIIFLCNIGITIYGLTQLTQGLELKDLSPDDSYLKLYDKLWADYLYENDLPVEVFYPEHTPWWDKRAINALSMFVDRVNARPENSLLNDPLTRMYSDVNLAPSLQSGNETEFLLALKEALTDSSSAYKQFEYDFIWKGNELVAFRQLLLPAGTASSEERAHWILQMREDCKWLASLPDDDNTIPIYADFYNYMLVFYESDIQIKKSVISSLTTASMAMLVIAFLLIPDLASGLMVISIMALIDVTIIGYMSFWDVPLNMISMVMLVISVGFAVDYSAHICYAFVNAIGSTRDVRVIESLVLVGTPLIHGAASNFIGIMLLGFSTSYILRIFFKMMTLVVLLGISHGVILLPVLLSLFGPMSGSSPVYKKDAAKAWDIERERAVSKVSMLSEAKSDIQRPPWYPEDAQDSKCETPLKDKVKKRGVDFDVPHSHTHNREACLRSRSIAQSENKTPMPKRR